MFDTDLAADTSPISNYYDPGYTPIPIQCTYSPPHKIGIELVSGRIIRPPPDSSLQIQLYDKAPVINSFQALLRHYFSPPISLVKVAAHNPQRLALVDAIRES